LLKTRKRRGKIKKLGTRIRTNRPASAFRAAMKGISVVIRQVGRRERAANLEESTLRLRRQTD
jgi:hypothetical protein